MKPSKSTLASVLLLALIAFGASAAPAPEMIPAETQPAAELQPSDVFGASVLSQSADCVVGAAVAIEGSDPWSICGQCSQDPCKGASVGAYCGFSGGKVKVCQDWLGMLCPAQDGVRCRCSSDPIP